MSRVAVERTVNAADEPMRVFVGTSPEYRLPFEVLCYSIGKQCSRPVTVTGIDGRRLRAPRASGNRPRTPFSFSRFDIPRLCQYSGRAIYLDSDMLVLDDVAKLWDCDLSGADLIFTDLKRQDAGARFSVMLLDCARLRWSWDALAADLDNGVYDYSALLQELCIVPESRRRAGVASRWNSLDRFDADTALLHYTGVPTQPWIYGAHPYGGIWYQHLRAAMHEGAIAWSTVVEEISSGHVSPALPQWVGLTSRAEEQPLVAPCGERAEDEATPREFFRWFRSRWWTKPWLVLGKGPTFSRRNAVDMTGYHTFGLNHVCREQPVELAHAIDLDVVRDLGETLLHRAKALVMPWRPHVDFRPSELTLEDAARENAVLGQLARTGRLFWYNLSTAPDVRAGSPVVIVCFFSGEAAVRLLAMGGARTVRTLGVDGGRRYAVEFADLRPLTNGAGSFDAQAAAIHHTVARFGLDFAPLFEVTPESEIRTVTSRLDGE